MAVPNLEIQLIYTLPLFFWVDFYLLEISPETLWVILLGANEMEKEEWAHCQLDSNSGPFNLKPKLYQLSKRVNPLVSASRSVAVLSLMKTLLKITLFKSFYFALHYEIKPAWKHFLFLKMNNWDFPLFCRYICQYNYHQMIYLELLLNWNYLELLLNWNFSQKNTHDVMVLLEFIILFKA